MTASTGDPLQLLRAALNKDIESDSISLIPPRAILQMLPMEDERTHDALAEMWFEHLLRRRITGWSLEQCSAHGASYLGMPPKVGRYLLGLMPAVVKAANAGASDLGSFTAQADKDERRLHQRLVAVAREAYARHGLTAFALPEEGGGTSPLPDGETINDSFSTNAPKVKADLRRVRRYDPEIRQVTAFCRRIALISTVVIALVCLLFATGHWILGSLLAILPLLAFKAVLMSFTGLVLVPRRTRQIFASALLTPAVVISAKPLRCLCVADLGNGAGIRYTGVKVLDVELPLTPAVVGKALPCASVFSPGSEDDRWSDFDPHPIEWATADRSELARCIAKLDADDRRILVEVYERWKKGEFRDEGTALWVLDAEGTVIAQTEKKAEKDPSDAA